MDTQHTDEPWLEIIVPDYPRASARAAIFDFDGTLSLLRRNWQDTMIPMMVEVLQRETDTRESPEQLARHVESFVMRLNGKQTIYQMIQLAEEVRSRGGSPRDPLEYKAEYHERLWEHVAERVERVRRGQIPLDEMTVPGSRELLQGLVERGIRPYLASGTDRHYVVDELETLGLAEFFEGRVWGALDDYRQFSKAMIIERMIEECGVRGGQLVAFGDGFVEIEETAKAGGLAIGVASDEVNRSGINDWKRRRLIAAGAHWIIADYREHESIVDRLVGG